MTQIQEAKNHAILGKYHNWH